MNPQKHNACERGAHTRAYIYILYVLVLQLGFDKLAVEAGDV